MQVAPNPGSSTTAPRRSGIKTLLKLAVRGLGFIFAALLLIAAVAGKLIWPSKLRAFFQAEQRYWRDLIDWVKRPLDERKPPS
jgi:hypothetical protein